MTPSGPITNHLLHESSEKNYQMEAMSHIKISIRMIILVSKIVKEFQRYLFN